MDLSTLFDNFIQSSDGNDSRDLIQNVQMNPSKKFHVNALGYSTDILDLFISSKNCSVVFHANDGFSKLSRQNFITNLPASAKPSRVVVVNDGISDPELKIYAGLGARILITTSTGNIDQLIAIAQNRIEIVKGDFTAGAIQSFTDKGATIV